MATFLPPAAGGRREGWPLGAGGEAHHLRQRAGPQRQGAGHPDMDRDGMGWDGMCVN